MQSTVASSDYIYRTVLPWKDIYSDLREAGCNEYHLSEILGKKRSTVEYWFQTGMEPKDSEARAILLVHTRYCGEEKTKIRLNQSTCIE
jgi:hypothetical protein